MKHCKPVIGITPLWVKEKGYIYMQPGYIDGIRREGGLPLVLTFTDDIDSLMDICDGFLFTGGPDINPELYGEPVRPGCEALCDPRDRFELPLMERCLEADKPLLGICRGMQLLNTVLGGTLCQDLPAEQPSPVVHKMEAPYDRVVHDVNILENTPLHKLLGVSSIGVNSSHHQAVNCLSTDLQVMARATDGIVESVWMPSRPMVWATQWHPERLYHQDDASRRIFAALIAASGNCISPK